MSNTSQEETVEHGLVFTVDELRRNTDKIIENVNTQGRPALITKGGRIVGAILPLKGKEARIIAGALASGEFKLPKGETEATQPIPATNLIADLPA